MPTAIVTGSGGLIGSESAVRFVEAGYDVVGIDNDMRALLLRPGGLDRPRHRAPRRERPPRFRSLDLDIRDADGIDRRLRRDRGDIDLVVHTAAQPSHDWAARDPQTDFASMPTAR